MLRLGDLVGVVLVLYLATKQDRFDAGMKASATSGWSNGAAQPTHPVVDILRGYQACVAGALYATAARRCDAISPTYAHWLMVPANLPFQLAYNYASLNRAGGYYDNATESYTKLWQHKLDLDQREKTDAHREGLARERAEDIYRFVNALEAGVVFGAVSVVSAVATWAGLGWLMPTYAQVAFIMLGNLAISNAWFGLPYQWPEALWQVNATARDPWKALKPLHSSPKPSY